MLLFYRTALKIYPSNSEVQVSAKLRSRREGKILEGLSQTPSILLLFPEIYSFRDLRGYRGHDPFKQVFLPHPSQGPVQVSFGDG